MNLKIAICDDNEMDRMKLQSMLTSYYISNDIDLSFDLFSSGKALFQQYKKSGDYQIVLLDIEMPEMNGIQIAEVIRATIDKHVIIVFISNYPQYMQQSFLVRPFYYITKPFHLTDIFDLMNKVVREIESSHVIYSLISTEKGDITINVRDVLFIEAINSRNNLLSFHFYDHQLTTKGTILHWQEQLTEYNFYRCYRSILLNLQHIHYFNLGRIILDNGCSVPISRRNEKELKALFLNTTIQLLNL
ncbi:MAG: response regulator transcription factor [Lachnospiraceae bacterium]|nr:response regulator transcription factor [Lachnospiraceae bacterium]